MSLHLRAHCVSCFVLWAAGFRRLHLRLVTLTKCVFTCSFHRSLWYIVLTYLQQLLSKSLCSFRRKAADMNSHLASSMLLRIRTQSASLKCNTSRSCVTLSGILNLTCVKTPLWSATAAQGFAVQSNTSVNTKSKMYFPRVSFFTNWRSPN